MPITKTAKRALRSSNRKQAMNNTLMTRFEIAVREARNKKSKNTVIKAVSLADRVAKKNLIHKNKASRIKSKLSKLLEKKSAPEQKSSKKK
jgi:small subunit ribosomal protein S20